METTPTRPRDAAQRSTFWEDVHDGHDVDGVSWWQSVPELSLGLVAATGVGADRPIIDVGAGWSTLVDHLLGRGYQDLTAIDLSTTALQVVRDRLGPAGNTVALEMADVLGLHPDRRYAIPDII